MNKQKIFILLVSMMLMATIALPFVSAYTDTTYDEEYTDENDAVNPVSDWYTFADWGFGTSEVNWSTNTHFINSTTNGGANYTFNTSADYRELYFDVEYINSWTTWQNHSGANFTIFDGSAPMVTINLFGANTSIAGDQNTLVVEDSTYTKMLNVSVTASNWYRITVIFYWWNNTIYVDVYDKTGTTDKGETWLDMSSTWNTADSFKILNTPSGASVCMYIDSLVLIDRSYSGTDTATTNIVQNILPILIAVMLMIFLVGMAFTMGISKEGLITFMILVILAIVVIMILMSTNIYY